MPFDSHPTEETIELYLMGLLPEPALGEFEYHFPRCKECQKRFEEHADYLDGMRDGSAALVRQPQKTTTSTFRKVAWPLAAAAALVMAFLALQPYSHPLTGPSAVVMLQSMRGMESQAPSGPAGRPLILVLDMTDLQPLPKYKLEVVDTVGIRSYLVDAAPQNNKLQAPLVKGLSAGAYFVRVYTPTQELLREYSLTIHR